MMLSIVSEGFPPQSSWSRNPSAILGSLSLGDSRACQIDHCFPSHSLSQRSNTHKMLLLRFLWEIVSRYRGPRSNNEKDISLILWITPQVLPWGWSLSAMTQKGHCFFENACNVYTIRTLNQSVFLNFYILLFSALEIKPRASSLLLILSYGHYFFCYFYLLIYLFVNDHMTTQHNWLFLTYLSGTTYYNYILSAFPLPVLSKV